MEFILGSIVVVVLCLILQVDMSIFTIAFVFAFGVMIVLSVMMLVLEGFIMFFKSEWKEAELLRFEKKEDQKHKAVIYQIEGKEHKCAFPANPEWMYKKDKLHKVLFSKARGKVYDKYSLIIYVIWSVYDLVLAFYWVKYII